MSEKSRKRLVSLVDALDLPEDVGGEFKLTLWGDGRLRLENHKGIISYDPALLSCAVPGGHLDFGGDGLFLMVLEPEELWIAGKLSSISLFLEGEK